MDTKTERQRNRKIDDKISHKADEVGKELLTDRLIAQTQWEKAYNELIEAKTAYKLQETEYLRVTARLLNKK